MPDMTGITTTVTIIIIGSIVLTLVIVLLVMRRVSPLLKSAKTMMDGVAESNRLRVSGTAAEATVLSVQPTGAMINYQPVIILTLEINPPFGAPYQAQIQTPVHQVHMPRIQPNQTVPVKIDPNNPNNIALDL